MAEHMQGRLFYQEKADAYTHVVRGEGNRFLFQLCQDTSGVAEANARRLAACWNFCDGTATEYLEGSSLGRMLTLSGQAELREALDEIRRNAQAVLDGGLPHFSREDFALACLMTAESVLKRYPVVQEKGVTPNA